MRLVYDVNKNSQASQAPLNLTATELLGKLAQLIPPPRRYRHHYHGVLSANSKYRSSVTQCAETMKIITYITNPTSIHKILTHLGENSEPPKMQTAQGPPDECCYEEGAVAVPYE